MNFKTPKDTDKYSWTKHSLEKMKFYGLSAQRVLRVLNHSERVEEAVAPGCLAGMQTVGAKQKTEIWVMWKEKSKSQKEKGKINDLIVNNNHKKIITAWRYPGVSKIRAGVPIPEDILRELEKMDNGE
ncbi:MAG TPA: hypothetical protein PLK76_02950 [bacterium]|nr:hypothetical protein [bacterium]